MGKADVDTEIPRLSVVGFQMVLVFPMGQVACSCLPIDGKTSHPEASSRACLPTIVLTHRPEQINLLSWLVPTRSEVAYPY